jgi:hypothetical protein
MLLQPEAPGAVARGADKAAASLSQAVEICMDMQRTPAGT